MIKEFLRRLFLAFIHNTRIYRYTNIYASAKIGKNCVIGSYTEIGDKVRIGNGTKIQAMVFIPKGVVIGDDVFIGPRVTFCNDLYPKASGSWKVSRTLVEDGASIGAGCVIRCGITIGTNAKIGAGAVVIKDVKPNQVVAGVPAKQINSKWKHE